MRDRITPGLRYCQDYYEDELRALVTPQTRWLDAGCGHQVLGSWRFEAEKELVGKARSVVGVDPDVNSVSKHRTISTIKLGTLEALPFPPNSFDLATANMVVEHLADPVSAFSEVSRILVPGGIFLFHTPNVKSYAVGLTKRFPDPLKRLAARVLEARKPEDVYPTYYRCNCSDVIRDVARRAGLEVVSISHVASDAVFALILPLAALELLWIKITMTEGAASQRTNLIVTLRKPIL